MLSASVVTFVIPSISIQAWFRGPPRRLMLLSGPLLLLLPAPALLLLSLLLLLCLSFFLVFLLGSFLLAAQQDAQFPFAAGF